VEFNIYGGLHWGIDNYRAFNYLSDFTKNWLKGVYMYQDDIRELISQSDHASIQWLWLKIQMPYVCLSLDDAY